MLVGKDAEVMVTVHVGRFLQTYSADDILFGNTFDRPLRLPWGSGAALKFMKYVCPSSIYFPLPQPHHSSIHSPSLVQIRRPHTRPRPLLIHKALGSLPSHLHHALLRPPSRRLLHFFHTSLPTSTFNQRRHLTTPPRTQPIRSHLFVVVFFFLEFRLIRRWFDIGFAARLPTRSSSSPAMWS